MHATLTHLFDICHNYTPVLNELKNEIIKEQSDKSRQSYCHLILTVHCLLHTHIIGRCKGKSLIVYYSVCGRLMLQFLKTTRSHNFFQFFFRTCLFFIWLCPISQRSKVVVFIFYGTFPKGAIIAVFMAQKSVWRTNKKFKSLGPAPIIQNVSNIDGHYYWLSNIRLKVNIN